MNLEKHIELLKAEVQAIREELKYIHYKLSELEFARKAREDADRESLDSFRSNKSVSMDDLAIDWIFEQSIEKAKGLKRYSPEVLEKLPYWVRELLKIIEEVKSCKHREKARKRASDFNRL